MKKILLLLLVTAQLFGAISADKKYKLDNTMGQVPRAVGLGRLIDEGGQTGLVKDGHQANVVLVGTYDFAVQGGASVASGGAITLGGSLGTIPAGAIITRSYIDVITTVAGTGASLALVVNNEPGSGEVKVLTAVSSWTSGFLEGQQTGAISLAKKISTAGALKLRISGNALTAGKFRAYVHYVMSQ